jgi:hypothetical protein
VWYSSLCEDVSLTPVEVLKHTLLRLAFSARLVVLAGPTLAGRQRGALVEGAVVEVQEVARPRKAASL